MRYARSLEELLLDANHLRDSNQLQLNSKYLKVTNDYFKELIPKTVVLTKGDGLAVYLGKKTLNIHSSVKNSFKNAPAGPC